MGNDTTIPWCNATINFWRGCTKVSEGCAHCYAEGWWKRARIKPGEFRRAKMKTVQDILRRCKAGDKVLVNSLSDFFHEGVSDDWRWEAFGVFDERPDLTFLLLTKRPERMREWIEMLEGEWGDSGTSRAKGWLEKWKHICLGVSVENQRAADERIVKLMGIDWPGKRFVSMEPLLGAVDMEPLSFLHTAAVGGFAGVPFRVERPLDWVIVGGESGKKARPMKAEWVRSIRDQCVAARVPFFFKGWGGATQGSGGNLLDGRVWEEMPGERFHHGGTEGTEHGGKAGS